MVSGLLWLCNMASVSDIALFNYFGLLCGCVWFFYPSCVFSGTTLLPVGLVV